jgi:hypothetical protein
MDVSRTLYAILFLAALAFPVRRFVLWFQENGFDWSRLIAEVTATQLGTGVTGAVLIASLAAIIFMIGECITRRDKLSIIAVPVTLVFGVAVGLPLYLYLRLRRIE